MHLKFTLCNSTVANPCLNNYVINSQGRKMSKTLGNVIDPIDTIKEFGTDALRFTLALGTAGQVCLAFK